MKYEFILVTLLVFTFTLVSGAGFEYTNVDSPTLQPPYIPNYTINTNNSDYWQGYTPATLPHNLLDNLVWSLSGHTIDTDFMPDASISYDIGSGVLRWGDLYVSDISADDIDVYDITAHDIDISGDFYSPFGNFSDIVAGDINITGVTTLNTTTVTENFTVNDLTGTYQVILSGTTIYSDALYAPLLQLGGNSIASGDYSVAVGLGAKADTSHSIALGSSAHSNGVEGVAIGTGSLGGYRAIALGYQSVANGSYSTASGYSAWAYGDNAVAIGNQVQANGDDSLAMGSHSRAEGDYSVSIGKSNNASGDNSYAFGDNITVAGEHSFGFGEDGTSTTDNTFSLHNLNLDVNGNISGTFIGDWNGSSEYWKSDGSSTATGNWNIGANVTIVGDLNQTDSIGNGWRMSTYINGANNFSLLTGTSSEGLNPIGMMESGLYLLERQDGSPTPNGASLYWVNDNISQTSYINHNFNTNAIVWGKTAGALPTLEITLPTTTSNNLTTNRLNNKGTVGIYTLPGVGTTEIGSITGGVVTGPYVIQSLNGNNFTLASSGGKILIKNDTYYNNNVKLRFGETAGYKGSMYSDGTDTIIQSDNSIRISSGAGDAYYSAPEHIFSGDIYDAGSVILTGGGRTVGTTAGDLTVSSNDDMYFSAATGYWTGSQFNFESPVNSDSDITTTADIYARDLKASSNVEAIYGLYGTNISAVSLAGLSVRGAVGSGFGGYPAVLGLETLNGYSSYIMAYKDGANVIGWYMDVANTGGLYFGGSAVDPIQAWNYNDGRMKIGDNGLTYDYAWRNDKVEFTSSNTSLNMLGLKKTIADTNYWKVDGNYNTYIPANLNITGNFTGNQIYGEVWYENHTATELTFAVQNANYTMFFTNSEDLNGFAFDGGFNKISNVTAQYKGKYEVFWRADGDGQNNHIYYATIFVNGVGITGCGDMKKMTAGGDITALSDGCLVDLNVGDVVDLRIRDETGTGTGNVYKTKLKLLRIGN